MKAGRNDPCPCGSGKKFKKCCISKEPPSPPLVPKPPRSGPPTYVPAPQPPAPPRPPAPPPPPPDPITLRGNQLWEEFEAQPWEGKAVVFLKGLDDPEVMTDDMAFEMLNEMHGQVTTTEMRVRFAECVRTFRERLPDVFAKGAHYHLSDCLFDALAEGWMDAVPALGRELAAHARRGINSFDHVVAALKYRGQLPLIVEMMRIAWPTLNKEEDEDDVFFPDTITDFANEAANYEVFDYLEQTASPGPLDPALQARTSFFIPEPHEEYYRKFIANLKGTSGRVWQVDDFAFRPPEEENEDLEDEEEDEEEPKPKDPALANLSDLCTEFIGYLQYQEGVPFPRGELIWNDWYQYFVRRHLGFLDPQQNIWLRGRGSNRKAQKPPPPVHPLCPERITFEAHLTLMAGMMSQNYHNLAALFQSTPAWLRFLESRQLIDADIRRKVVDELLPLHASVLNLMKTYKDDPAPARQLEEWPADAAKDAP